MTIKQRQEKERQLREAMAELVHDTRFQKFIDLIRDHREAAIADSLLVETVNSQRASLFVLGEIKALNNIIGAYDDFLDQPPMQQPEELE